MKFRHGKAREVYVEGRANGTIDEYGDPVALPAGVTKPQADEDSAPALG